MKVFIVAILTVATVIHFVVAYKTNGKKRTREMEQILSRSSSMLIFILNLFVLHYAIILRNIL